MTRILHSLRIQKWCQTLSFWCISSNSDGHPLETAKSLEKYSKDSIHIKIDLYVDNSVVGSNMLVVHDLEYYIDWILRVSLNFDVWFVYLTFDMWISIQAYVFDFWYVHYNFDMCILILACLFDFLLIYLNLESCIWTFAIVFELKHMYLNDSIFIWIVACVLKFGNDHLIFGMCIWNIEFFLNLGKCIGIGLCVF